MALSARAATASASETVVIAPRMVMPDGSIQPDRALVIGEDGTIVRVISAADVPAASKVVRFESGVISPGLIDVRGSAGVRGDVTEQAIVVDPEAVTLDAFDTSSIELQRALRAGVTAVMLTPDENNVIAGRSATARTWAFDESVRTLSSEAALHVVLSSSTFSANREPSSRAGALALLRRTWASNAEPQSPLGRAQAGKLPVIVTCEEAQDAMTALTFFGPRNVSPILSLRSEADVVASEVIERGTTAIIGPYSFNTDGPTLRGGAALERAGAIVVFGGDVGVGDPDRLRITAALAVRYGLSPEHARRGLTVEAARVAGAADRIGALQSGLEADFVVFSDDPLRLDAEVIEVWIAGRRAWSAASLKYGSPGTGSAPGGHDRVIGATHEQN